MPLREEGTNGSFWGSSLMWTLLIMVVIVLGLAIWALLSPISQPTAYLLDAATQTSLPSENGLTPTPGPDYLYLDPEEIGHTDGIILLSAVLLLILVVGTFRETYLRNKANHHE